MDAKYLAEIKAREQVATPGPWVSIFGLKGRTVYDMSGENGKVIAKLRNTKHGNQDFDSAFIAHARADIPALLAEVKRLTIENLGLKDAAIRCDGYERKYYASLTELDVKNQQIVTLKRALELMSRTACGEMPGTMPEWDMVGCVPDKSCMKENPCKGSDNECHECWTRYFIHQAQEQEAEK